MIFNPIDSYYKSQIGAIKEDTLVKFRLRCFCDYAFMVVYDENGYLEKFKMKKIDDHLEVDVCLKSGLYWYYFELNNGEFVGANEYLEGVITDNANSFQLSVYKKDFETPNFIKGGIIYQIFPDRFYRSEEQKKIADNKVLHKSWNETPIYLPNEYGEVMNNDFFGGDIKGIIEKLDYLKQLNVSVIYLNPIFEAFSNHRYDTGDYFKIDSLLGTEEDFKRLIKKADEKGIKIILDGVFNHTGSNSIYFNRDNNYSSVGAYQSKDSKYYEWYSFMDYPNIYESWWGIKTLPAVNKNNDEFLNFIAGENGVIEHYTRLGIGGWRLDVVDELPERFSRAITKAVKGINKDAIVIGEVWEDASNKIAYGKRRKYFLGEELDSVMNYPLKNAIIDYVLSRNVDMLKKVIREQVDHYPKICLDSLMNILGTHDTFRILSALSNIDVADKCKRQMENLTIATENYSEVVNRLKIAVLLSYTLYGVPSVFYGDEVGMQGFSDPLNRRTFPWDSIDEDILSFYQTMGRIRQNSAFVDGEYKEIVADKGTLVFARQSDNSDVLVAVNVNEEEYILKFSGRLQNLLDNNIYQDEIVLKKNNYYVLINAKDN